MCELTWITDAAPGLAWSRRAELPNPDREGGKGLLFSQAFTDQATSWRGPGHNVPVLRKQRSEPTATCPAVADDLVQITDADAAVRRPKRDSGPRHSPVVAIALQT